MLDKIINCLLWKCWMHALLLKKGSLFKFVQCHPQLGLTCLQAPVPHPHPTSPSDLQSVHFTHSQTSYCLVPSCIILLLASLAGHLCHISYHHLTHIRPFCKAFFEHPVCRHSTKPQYQVAIMWFSSWNLLVGYSMRFLAKCLDSLFIALFHGAVCSLRAPSSKNNLEDLRNVSKVLASQTRGPELDSQQPM